MSYEESIKWLENLKSDIGQGDPRLWQYEQALSEIIDLLQATKDKIENRALVELPKPFIDEAYFIDSSGKLHIRYEVYQNVIRAIHRVEDTFTTKKAAKVRLKELTGGEV